MTSCIIRDCYSSTTRDLAGIKVSLHLFPDPRKEPERHLRWAKIINSDKVYAKDPTIVFRQFRVCRNHFDEDSFNGICKKLLSTAIPTRNIPQSNLRVNAKKFLEYEKRVQTILKRNSINLGNDQLSLLDEPMPKMMSLELPVDDGITLVSATHDQPEQYELLIDDQSYGDDQITILIKSENNKTYGKSPKSVLKPKLLNEQFRKSSNVESESDSLLMPLNLDMLANLQNTFERNDKNRLAQTICSKLDPIDVAISRTELDSANPLFQHKIDLDFNLFEKKIERNWDFIGLNLMKHQYAKMIHYDEFEFSHTQFYYWDKIERSYFFLNNIVTLFKSGLELDSREISALLNNPIDEGGQWDMIVNIINKHGVMPKKCFPESFNSESSARMNAIIKSKLREYAKQIRDSFTADLSLDDIQSTIDQQMSEIYNIVGICLGIPPATFIWEYYDKNKKYHTVGPVTAVEFYENHVKPHFNVNDKVCLVTDPRPSNEYGKGYTVECLGNVVGGRPVSFSNQPIEIFADSIERSIKCGKPVWAICGLNEALTTKIFDNDLSIIDYKPLLDIYIERNLAKAEKLDVGNVEKFLTLLITGLSINQEGIPTHFLVANLAGSQKKHLTMTREWLEEFMFFAVIDKSHVRREITDSLECKPEILPQWDPLGRLAA